MTRFAPVQPLARQFAPIPLPCRLPAREAISEMLINLQVAPLAPQCASGLRAVHVSPGTRRPASGGSGLKLIGTPRTASQPRESCPQEPFAPTSCLRAHSREGTLWTTSPAPRDRNAGCRRPILSLPKEFGSSSPSHFSHGTGARNPARPADPPRISPPDPQPVAPRSRALPLDTSTRSAILTQRLFKRTPLQNAPDAAWEPSCLRLAPCSGKAARSILGHSGAKWRARHSPQSWPDALKAAIADDMSFRNPPSGASNHESVRKNVQRLEKLLRTLVPLPGKPFRNESGKFVPCFKISLHPDLGAGFAQRQAR